MAGGDGARTRGLEGTNRQGAPSAGSGKGRAAQIHAPGGEHRWAQEPVFAQGISAPVKGIADTGYLVAFANRGDQHHAWAVSLARDIESPLLTCEAVLAETAFHLGDVSVVLAMVDEGLVTLAFNCADHFRELGALAKRYGDRHPDLADLCLIRMSELHPRHPILTVDKKDFRVYRRNKRKVIPLVCPPDRSR